MNLKTSQLTLCSLMFNYVVTVAVLSPKKEKVLRQRPVLKSLQSERNYFKSTRD